MRWTAKRFWIMEALCLLPSIYPIYSCYKELEFLPMIAVFLLSSIVCGIYSFIYSSKTFSNLFLKSWFSYNIVFVVAMSIICIFSNIQILGYIILFGFIVAIYTLIPFLIVIWLYKLIIKKMV